MSITLGNPVTLSTTVGLRDPVSGVVTPADDSGLMLHVREPDGNELDFAAGVLSHPSVGNYYYEFVATKQGVHTWRWVGDSDAQGASEGSFEVESIFVPRDSASPLNVRSICPRVQRAVEGVVQGKWQLDIEQVKDLTADALGDILLYTGGNGIAFKLNVVGRDPQTSAPSEYETDKELTLVEQAVVAAQAALNYFFFRFGGIKTAETIADEASHWSWEISPTLLIQQLKVLQAERDKAIEALQVEEGVLDSYISFIAVRDTMTARYIEPWVWGHPEGQGVGFGGLEGDFRFDQIASGGGDYALTSGDTGFAGP